MMYEAVFYILSAIALIGGLIVVTGRNPITSAVALVVTLGAVAGHFVLLDAHFVATIQVLVYAGAIMVLFVFVIMLLNLHPDELETRVWDGARVAGMLLVGAGTLMLLRYFLQQPAASMGAVAEQYGTLEMVGQKLFLEYLIPFESISFLLTSAVVGAVVIGKRDL